MESPSEFESAHENSDLPKVDENMSEQEQTVAMILATFTPTERAFMERYLENQKQTIREQGQQIQKHRQQLREQDQKHRQKIRQKLDQRIREQDFKFNEVMRYFREKVLEFFRAIISSDPGKVSSGSLKWLYEKTEATIGRLACVRLQGEWIKHFKSILKSGVSATRYWEDLEVFFHSNNKNLPVGLNSINSSLVGMSDLLRAAQKSEDEAACLPFWRSFVFFMSFQLEMNDFHACSQGGNLLNSMREIKKIHMRGRHCPEAGFLFGNTPTPLENEDVDVDEDDLESYIHLMNARRVGSENYHNFAAFLEVRDSWKGALRDIVADCASVCLSLFKQYRLQGMSFENAFRMMMENSKRVFVMVHTKQKLVVICTIRFNTDIDKPTFHDFQIEPTNSFSWAKSRRFQDFFALWNQLSLLLFKMEPNKGLDPELLKKERDKVKVPRTPPASFITNTSSKSVFVDYSWKKVIHVHERFSISRLSKKSNQILKRAYSKEGKKSLQRENNVLKLLKHPNIPKLIYFGFDQFNSLILITEGFGSSNLLNVKLTKHQISSVCETIASALKFIHENGMVYCDLHPGNVVINRKLVHKNEWIITDLYLIDYESCVPFGKTYENIRVNSLTSSPESFPPTNQVQPEHDFQALELTKYLLCHKILPYGFLSFFGDLKSIRKEKLKLLKEINKSKQINTHETSPPSTPDSSDENFKPFNLDDEEQLQA